MKLITLFVVVMITLSSCGIFTNISEPPNQVINENRDYILINKTPYNNLRLFYTRETQADCSTYVPLTVMTLNSHYAFHVNPGETVFIMYCTPDDVFCTGCRIVKLIGNSETHGNNVEL